MRRNRSSNHHEPDDPDIARAIRARREELGLSVSQIAQRAGVSEQTWRNYESDRTRVRGDKQAGVWRALDWEPPTPWFLRPSPAPWPAGPMDPPGPEDWEFVGPGGPGGAADRAVPYSLTPDGEPDDDPLPLPRWEEIPAMLPASYSSLLAGAVGETGARCFALGAFLYDQTLAEDLEVLGALPRGTHLGELEDSRLGATLPRLWLTRYDYELVFQLRTLALDMCLRLTMEQPGPDDPLVRSMAEALVLHDILSLGCFVAASRGAEVADGDEEAWVNALCGPDEPAHRMLLTNMVPPPQALEHIDNWFAPLPEPFVPEWGSARVDGPAPERRATVTPLHGRRG